MYSPDYLLRLQPLRIEDKRSSVVFAVKNFVLELKPEVYSFNSQNDEEQYDICDDHSGVCHEMAQSRINMYVNECSSHGLSTIHAEHDPEGHVHYLFGQKQSGFEMLANGEEREIFVNYGPDYEDVRIRKNYSFLGEEEQQLRRENMKLELIEYLQSTATRLSAKDILDVVAYFTGALGEFLDKANENAKFRLLVASLLLRYRACWLMQRNQQLPINRKRSIDTKQISAAVERSKHLAFTMLQSHGDKQLILLYAKGKDENLIRTVVVNFLSAAGTPKDRAVSFLDGLFDSRDRVG